MTDNSEWRPIAPEEVAMVTTIIEKSEIPEGHVLLEDLDGAVVSQRTRWIFDLRTPNTASMSTLPNGPFPTYAFVPNRVAYQGEILIWIEGGHLSGLEYAWVTDDPPTRWPRPDEMEIAAQ